MYCYILCILHRYVYKLPLVSTGKCRTLSLWDIVLRMLANVCKMQGFQILACLVTSMHVTGVAKMENNCKF